MHAAGNPTTASWRRRRGQLETYFDRTAREAWKRLTSDAPVGRIRATVRAGREEMRATLVGWLEIATPAAAPGVDAGPAAAAPRVLDAGCGTGALALDAARGGARVTAVDVSASLVEMARERLGSERVAGSIRFVVGDMLDALDERYDHAVLMDSLIHYRSDDIVRALGGLATRVDRSILFTFAPRTPALTLMHAAGKLFPRGNRSPAIEPVGEARLRRLIASAPSLAGWRCGRTHRVSTGFYISQAMELCRR
ncbi:MAG: magnesium protoporphyrin IX methyltransferase [Lautropia sp.]